MRTDLRSRLREALRGTWGTRPERCLGPQTDAALAVFEPELNRYRAAWLSTRRRCQRLRAQRDEWEDLATRADELLGRLQAELERTRTERDDLASQLEAYKAMRQELAETLGQKEQRP